MLQNTTRAACGSIGETEKPKKYSQNTEAFLMKEWIKEFYSPCGIKLGNPLQS